MKNQEHFVAWHRTLIIVLAAFVAFGISACKNPANPDTGPVALTGTVSIPDTIFLGDTVTADTSDLAGTGTIKYQWQTSSSADRGFNNITNATQSSFEVNASTNVREGRFLRVRVSREGYEGNVSSDAVKIQAKPLEQLTGTVSIPQAISFGDTVTADIAALNGDGTVSYQWQTGASLGGEFTDITGATQGTFLVQASTDVAAGRFLRVTVTRVGYEGKINSNEVEIKAATLPELTGIVFIQGTASLNQSVSANTDGLVGNGTISYEWQTRPASGGSFVSLQNGGGKNFFIDGTLANVAVGRYLRVTVTRVGYEGSIDSNEVVIEAAESPALGGSVFIQGTVSLDQTVSANTSALGGSGETSYWWQTSDSATGEFTNITNATEESFFITEGAGVAEGRYLRVTVARSGNSGRVSSTAVVIGARPVLTGNVSIPTIISLGDTVVANITVLSGNGAIGYQWQTRSATGEFSNITNATQDRFAVNEGTNVAVGYYLRVAVTRSDRSGSIYSNEVEIKTATLPGLVGTVTIQGTAFVGATVSANTSDLNGSGTYSYQWKTSASATGEFTNISTATGGNFFIDSTVDTISAGRYLMVTVTCSGNAGSVDSNVVQIGAAIDDNRVFIDFSGFNGSVPFTLTTHLPPEGTQGPFGLSNGVIGNGLRLADSGDVTTVTIDQYGNGKAVHNDDFLVFFVDNNNIKNIGTITMAVTFFDDSSGNFSLQYVSKYNTHSWMSIPKKGSNTFVTERIQLDDCGFGSGYEQQGHGNQFRFGNDAIIQKIELEPAVLSALTGTVTIPNTIRLGDNVTANTTALGGSGAISYQWQTGASADGGFTNIATTTENSFAVNAGNNISAGRYLRVTVTRSGNTESVSSNAVVIGAAQTGQLTGSVFITQTIFLDDTVIANTSNLEGSGDIGYQWQTAASPSDTFTDIATATGKSFVVTAGTNIAVGRYLRVIVTRSGNTGNVISNAVAIVSTRARAFIDLSGYNNTVPFTLSSHQPQQPGVPGDFDLSNGIIGSGLRIGNNGDEGSTVINRHGGGIAAKNNIDNFLHFYVDNTAVKALSTVTMAVTFFDNSSGDVGFQYTAASGTHTGGSFSKGGTNAYVTVRIELNNCRFDTAQGHGNQIRISGGIIIQRVELVDGGLSDVLNNPPPSFAAPTSFNNMIGKVVTGYQVWFNANSWHHWEEGGGIPRPGYVHVEIWPSGWDDYKANGVTLHNTGFTMPDGSTAQLFNSHDREVIRTHLKWMQDADIGGPAIQRFFGTSSAADSGSIPTHLTHIRDAAEEFQRIFYVMYDMSGAANDPDPVRRIKLDWIFNIENKGLVSSPSYAQAEGKPVVCIWGLNHTWTDNFLNVEQNIELFTWFRDRGYYIIGGTEYNEYYNTTGRDKLMYTLCDMIAPWWVGRAQGSVSGNDTWTILGSSGFLARGLKFCSDNPREWVKKDGVSQPITFMPLVSPGGGWTNMGNNGPPNSPPRLAGQRVWEQVQPYLNGDTNNVIQSFYLAMMDEYDEATAWMKAGVDYFDIPINQYFQTYATDGKWVSSDYYLRMAKAVAAALTKKNNAGGGSTTPGPKYTYPLNDYSNQNSVIVEHSNGPIFWRNSFERREGRKIDAYIPTPVYHLQMDVGVPNGSVISSTNVTVSGDFSVNRPSNNPDGAFTPASTSLGTVYNSDGYVAKSGESAFRLAGTRNAGNGGSYLYKIADTRIKGSNSMKLSFWQKAENTLGANVVVDLLLDNGTYVSAMSGYNLQGTASVNNWVQRTADLPNLNGRYITAVIMAYRDSDSATGNFAALIDDVVIENL